MTATDAIVISGRDDQGQPSGLSSNTSGSGDAGSLSVSAPTLHMDDGGFMRTANPPDPRGLLSSRNAGRLEVRVRRLTLSGGAQLSSSTFGQGRGGDLTVTATDAIVISGRDSQGQPSGLFSETFGNGDAGSLSVSAPRLTLSGGARLSSSTAGQGRGGALSVMATDAIVISGRDGQGQPSGLFSETSGNGDAGSLSVSAPRLTLSGGARLSSSTAGQGRGGALSVMATDAIVISGRDDLGQPSGLSSDTSGSGDAGLCPSQRRGSRSLGVPSSAAAHLVKGGAGT